jgi:redox-sensitive bicupin YhaK (pirin superfamily)
MEGFQLWLNLPARDKLCQPWYRDFSARELPRFETASGASVTVIAGSSHGVEGAVQRPGTEPLYLDVHLPPGARFEQLIGVEHNAFIYVYRGQVTIAGEAVPVRRMAILAQGATSGARTDGVRNSTNGAAPAEAADGVVIEAGGDGARLLLIAGRPLNEPIAQYGPFVMNTQQELHQAVADYRSGRLA